MRSGTQRHKGSSGFHSLLGQAKSFNYPQRVCTVAYGVEYSPSLSIILFEESIAIVHSITAVNSVCLATQFGGVTIDLSRL